MTRDENIKLIRERCVAANPELVDTELDNYHLYLKRPIRLADVLLAFSNHYGQQASNEMTWSEDVGAVVGRWNLRKDDLTEQSDECVAFLADLLK